MGVEIIVPVALFLTLFAIIATVMYFRFRTRQELQVTVRAAVESGQNLSAEVLEELMASLDSSRNDLRRGIIAIAIGLALVVLGFAAGQEEAAGPMLGLSAFPFFVGIAYVGLWFFNRDNKTQA